MPSLSRELALARRHMRPLSRPSRASDKVYALRKANQALTRQVADRCSVIEELRFAEERYRSLVEQMPAVLYLAELGDTYSAVYVSPQIEGLLEMDPQAVRADPDWWLHALHPQDREQVLQRVDEFARRGDTYFDEYRLITSTGKVRWVQDRARVIRSGSGERGLIQGILLDVSQRRRAEEALERQLAENQQLYNQTFQRTLELQVLADFTATLRKANKRQTMLPLLLERARRALRADGGALLLQEGQSLCLVAALEPLDTLIGLTFHPSLHTARDPLWLANQSGLPACFAWNRSDQVPKGDLIGLLTTSAQACALIPLRSAEGSLGVLFLTFNTPFVPGQDWQRMQAAIADMAASALQRTSITEALEAMALNRTKELQTIYKITSRASETVELKAALETSLGELLDTMNCPIGSIHLLEDESQKLTLAVMQGVPAHVVPNLAQMGQQEGLAGWVLSHGEATVSPNVQLDDRTSFINPGVDALAAASMPMRNQGVVLGVLTVLRPASRPFAPEEVAMLTAVADHLGLAVENARLRQQAEAAAVMQERARLSRELHDSVTQSLYSITLFAEAGKRLMDLERWDRVRQNLGTIFDVGHQSLKEMRLLIFELRPPDLESEGLVGALRQRLNTVERRASITTQLEVDSVMELPLPVERELYRIAQEALNNALKHAHASEVAVHLHIRQGWIVLEVMDNGQGFDPAVVQGGLGLRTMRERVRRLNGEISFNSNPAQGTEVCARIPLPDAAASDLNF